MIKLHSVDADGNRLGPIWIAPQHVVSIRPDRSGKPVTVVITTECRDDEYYRVGESAEHVAEAVTKYLDSPAEGIRKAVMEVDDTLLRIGNR